MPCYFTKTGSPSRDDFQLWQNAGYTGTYQQYEDVKGRFAGSNTFICGDLGDQCADCQDLGKNLCDFPVGDGKTCDRLVCEEHGREVAPNIHYCNAHYAMWTEFRDAGGVADELRNVVAFKGA